MFFEALQAYYAPVILLIVFVCILAGNQLLTRREQRLFLLELGIIGLMLVTTWTDRCISAITTGGWWQVRFLTSALQFGLAPLSPLVFLRIYRRNLSPRREWLLSLPAITTAALTFSSFWTRLVLWVEPGNVYHRGPLFLLPFLSSALYMVVILHSTSQRETPGRQRETAFLLGAGVAIAGACILEIVFVIRYMIWSTTAVMLLSYFLLITFLKVLYDPQTGVYSRLAYTNRLESVRADTHLTLAMVDLNGLKSINDRFGHHSGDQAIRLVSQTLLSLPLNKTKLYRYGGDEFILVSDSWCGPAMEEALKAASYQCGAVEGFPLSFAYGVKEYRGGNLHTFTDEIDWLMYQNKLEMKMAERGFSSTE